MASPEVPAATGITVSNNISRQERNLNKNGSDNQKNMEWH